MLCSVASHLGLHFSLRHYRVIIVDIADAICRILGPVVRSFVSLTSSLRVISLTVLADSIHNILIFFAEKM